MQVEAAFLPGRIAENHITLIAKHLLRVIGSVSESCGMVSAPVAALTKRLGEPCIELGSFAGIWYAVFGKYIIRGFVRRNFVRVRVRS